MKKQNDNSSKITDARRETYLTKEVAELLIQQIGYELENEYLYYNFAIWYDMNSFFGQAEYFMKRSAEERTHAQWIIDYLKQSDYLFQIPAPRPEMLDIYEGKKMEIIWPHKKTIDREIETTEAIKKIYEKAIEMKDYITSHWLKQLLEEQAEEESLSHTAVDVFQHTKDPLLVDQYFKNVVLPTF